MTAVLPPNLDRLCDAEAMRAELQQRLPQFADAALRIDALRVQKARRSASRRNNPHPLTVVYEIDVADPVRRRHGKQLLYGKVYRNGTSAIAYHQAAGTLLAAPAFGAALAHLPEFDMLVWSLPNDPGLPQLAGLLDLTQLPRLLQQRIDRTASTVELLRYEPEQRATLLYTLVDATFGGTSRLFAKTFCDAASGAQICHRFDYFAEKASDDPAAPLVARSAGYDASTRTLFQYELAGVPLARALAVGEPRPIIDSVARALAALHDAPLPAPPRAPWPHWIVEAKRRRTKLVRALPALANRLDELVVAIERRCTELTMPVPCLIHGDFHPLQVEIRDARIVFHDFDEFRLGDPMEDLAGFIVKLELAGDAGVEQGRLMAACYAACAPNRFDQARLDWHLTVQWLLQASRAFVFQRQGWRESASDYLQRALRASQHETAPGH